MTDNAVQAATCTLLRLHHVSEHKKLGILHLQQGEVKQPLIVMGCVAGIAE